MRIVAPRFHDPRDPREPGASFVLGLPLRRFRPPRAANVRVVRHAPVQVDSTAIVEKLGPYRASGDWWEREQWSAEEWDVDLGERGLLRLRRDPAGWFIDGCYDA